METREGLNTKLEKYYGLLDIIVYKRKTKIIARLLLSIPFYYFLWHITWVRWMFWIGLPLEIVMSLGTVFFYFRLHNMIRKTKIELELIRLD